MIRTNLHENDPKIFQNGTTQRLFAHAGNQFTLAYGRLIHQADNQYHRLTLGYTRQEDTFYSAPTNRRSALTSLPENRNFSYPWVEYQYLQADYQVMKDIYLTNQQEDINLGWQHTFKLGLETQPLTNNDYGVHAQWQWKKGYLWPQTLLLFSGQLNKTYHVQERDLLYACIFRPDLNSDSGNT